MSRSDFMRSSGTGFGRPRDLAGHYLKTGVADNGLAMFAARAPRPRELWAARLGDMLNHRRGIMSQS